MNEDELIKEAEEKAIEVYGSNNWSVCAYKNGYLASAKPRDEKIAELEQENAELKEEGRENFNEWLDACHKYGIVNLKLTKAKRLYKKVIRLFATGYKRPTNKLLCGSLYDRSRAILKRG